MDGNKSEHLNHDYDVTITSSGCEEKNHADASSSKNNDTRVEEKRELKNF